MTTLTDYHRKQVINYYNSTKGEYRLIWRSNHSLGIHFGYYDNEHKSHDAAIININRKLANAAQITKNDNVLDAGCGMGGTALWLAAEIGCRATGINIVPWQIDRANALAKKRQLEKFVNFQMADFADTKLKPGAYTVVLGLESIVHAEDKQAVINEAYRLLHPKGRLVISEYLLNEKKLEPDEQILINQWLRGWAMPSLLTEKQYVNHIRKAGFRQIELYDWTDQVRPSLRRLERFIKIFNPVAPTLAVLRIINKGQLENIKASDAQMKTLAKDDWRYKVIVAQKP